MAGRNQGIQSRQKREVGQRLGKGNRGVSAGAVASLGAIKGNHVDITGTTNYRGEGKIHQGQALRPAPMGNEVAVKTVCGPGGSRTIYGKSGTQQQHGPVAGSPKLEGRPWYNEYTPSKKAQI